MLVLVCTLSDESLEPVMQFENVLSVRRKSDCYDLVFYGSDKLNVHVPAKDGYFLLISKYDNPF